MSAEILQETGLPTIDEIKQAQELVYEVMPPTAQYVWPLLCERLGGEVWVKHENHPPSGRSKRAQRSSIRHRSFVMCNVCRDWSRPRAAIMVRRGAGGEQVRGAGAHSRAQGKQCGKECSDAGAGSRARRVRRGLPGVQRACAKACPAAWLALRP